MSNLLNPMQRDSIYRSNKGEYETSVQTVSRSFYERLLTKDPNTFYVLSDTGEVYLGDKLMNGPATLNKPPRRFMYIRDTPDGNEYVIAAMIGNRTMDVCSYKDPHDALNDLKQKKQYSSDSEAIYNIKQLLASNREKGFDRTNSVDTIIGIVETVFRANNATPPSDTIMDLIVYRSPFAIVPTNVCDVNNPEHMYLKRSREYGIYCFIWDYLFSINNLDTKRFNYQSEEDKWILGLSKGIYNELVLRYLG